MISEPQLTDSPEFDEFFRQGDEQSRAGDSLQPFARIESEVAPEARQVRTPAQRERRAKLIKFVSLTMACLTTVSIGATFHVVKGNERLAPGAFSFLARATQSDGKVAANTISASQVPYRVRAATQLAHAPADSASPGIGAVASGAADVQPVKRALLLSEVAPASEAAKLEPDRPFVLGTEPSARIPGDRALRGEGDADSSIRSSAIEKTQAQPASSAKKRGATHPLAGVMKQAPHQRRHTAPMRGTQPGASSTKPEIPIKPADYRPPTASFAD